MSVHDRRMNDLWVPETVKQRFEAAGRALMALPLPQGTLPGQPRSSWPAVAQRAEDAFAAMIGASEEIRRDFLDDRHRLRLPPSARALADMDIPAMALVSGRSEEAAIMPRAVIATSRQRPLYRKLSAAR